MSTNRHVYLSQEIEQSVERLADKEQRSFSAMMRILVNEALTARARKTSRQKESVHD